MVNEGNNNKEQKMSQFAQFTKSELEIIVKNTSRRDQPETRRAMEAELATR